MRSYFSKKQKPLVGQWSGTWTRSKLRDFFLQREDLKRRTKTLVLIAQSEKEITEMSERWYKENLGGGLWATALGPFESVDARAGLYGRDYRMTIIYVVKRPQL